MKFTTDAAPPYQMTWAANLQDAQKWLTRRLEEGYVLDSASAAPITYTERGEDGAVFQTHHMRIQKETLLTVRYDPEAAAALVKRCNG